MAILRNISFVANGGITQYPVAPSAKGQIVEGMALIGTMINGVMHATPSTDSAATFLGIAFGPRRETTATSYKTKTVVVDDQNLTVNLQDTAVVSGASGNPRIYTVAANGTVTEFTIGSTAQGVVVVNSLSPLSLTFNAADDGKTVYVAYNYVGGYEDLIYGGGGFTPTAFMRDPHDVLGYVGVLGSGTIALDQIDANSTWSGSGSVRAIAGGLFTWASSGGTDVGLTHTVVVKEAPGPSKPYVVLAVNQ